jgi:hypothetical protein
MEETMRKLRTARRTLAAIVFGTSLTLLTAGVAFAEAPHHVMLPDAACNQGTLAARVISGNGVVPMYMATTPIGCMTMPGAFLP